MSILCPKYVQFIPIPVSSGPKQPPQNVATLALAITGVVVVVIAVVVAIYIVKRKNKSGRGSVIRMDRVSFGGSALDS